MSTAVSPAAPSTSTPIVVFGDDWGRNVSTMQHLFQIIAATHPVIWVNGIGHRLPTLRIRDLRRAAQKFSAMLRPRASLAPAPVTAGIAPRRIIHPRVLPWHHLRVVRQYNTSYLERTVRRVLAEEGFAAPPIIVTGTPPSAPIIGRLDESCAVYLCMDDFIHLPGVSNAMLAPLERELLSRVDATVATASALVESKRPLSGRSYYLPQGVNWEHFSTPRSCPTELRDLPRPLIGFAGGVTTPFDFELVRAIADAVRGGSVALVGPVGEDFPGIDLPNVHVLGRRPYAELPAYVQAFDVGLIPYHLNGHTLAVDPLKLLEYLAAGVAVVSTDLPEVRKYSDAISIAGTREAFVAAVVKACGTNGSAERASRSEYAARHSWSERAATLMQILAETAESRAAKA